MATSLMTTIVRDDGVWLAWIEGTAGARAWGRSIAQALTRLDIALDLLGVEEPFDTRIELAPALRTTVGAARSARQRADHASREARNHTREAVHRLAERGYSDRDIAYLLGISHQHVQRNRGSR